MLGPPNCRKVRKSLTASKFQKLVHSGFALPKNDIARLTMSEGWKKVVQNIGGIVDGKD